MVHDDAGVIREERPKRRLVHLNSLAPLIEQRPGFDALQEVVLCHRGQHFGRFAVGVFGLQYQDGLTNDHAAFKGESVTEGDGVLLVAWLPVRLGRAHARNGDVH